MFLELIATVFAGLAAAGVMMLLGRLTGGRLPRWLTPVAAGLAMIGVTIASEYGWYNRTVSTLPEGLTVAETVEKTAFYQPWTYLVPYIDRFVAVDAGTLRSHPDVPGQHIAQLYFFGRWSPVTEVPVLVDCDGSRRADLMDNTSFGADGAVLDVDWIAVDSDDPIVATVCEAT